MLGVGINFPLKLKAAKRIPSKLFPKILPSSKLEKWTKVSLGQCGEDTGHMPQPLLFLPRHTLQVCNVVRISVVAFQALGVE